MQMTISSSEELKGAIRPAPDKSTSHRALILGALLNRPLVIENLLQSEDVLHTKKILQQLGTFIQKEAAIYVLSPKPWARSSEPLYFGNSGTTVRLMMGALAGKNIPATFTGDKSLSSRPMQRIIAPLSEMGARFTSISGCLPAQLQSGIADGDYIFQPPEASAQVKSALLLAALGMKKGSIEIAEAAPTRDHTESMLKDMGIAIEYKPGWVKLDMAEQIAVLQPEQEPHKIIIPADPSSAAFALVAATIVDRANILVEGVMENPRRSAVVDSLLAMGALIDRQAIGGAERVNYHVKHTDLIAYPDPKQLTLRAADQIDEYPVLAVAAAFATGTTRFEQVGELRKKESDRITLMVAGLQACGVEAEEWEDGFSVTGCGRGGVNGGATIRTDGDHRIAMSFAILGMAARQPVVIEDAQMIDTSYPDFVTAFSALGAKIEPYAN